MRRALVALLAARAAAADEAPVDWASLWESAEEVTDLASALQPYLQTCAYEEAYLNRQCEALKERLMYLGARRRLRYTLAAGAGGATVVRGRQVVLRGCLTCDGPAALEEGLTGGGLVLAQRPSRVETTAAGLSILGIDLATAALAADDDPAKVAPALVTELVFRARNEAPALVTGRPYILADIVGYRVYDRCAGKVYLAEPAGGEAPVAMEKTDPTCPGYVPPVVEVKEDLPETLTADEITRVMENAREDVLVCYDRYGQAGYAPATLVVGGVDGRIRSVEIGGEFAGTDTAACIVKVMQAVTFPRFAKDDLKIDWQFYLQE